MFTQTYIFIIVSVAILRVQARIREHPDWPPHQSRNILDYMKPSEDTARLKPDGFFDECPPGLVWIFVTVAAPNFARRQIIRETWGATDIFNHLSFNCLHPETELNATETDHVRVTFLMGKSDETTMERLAEENELYGDILQEDFIDTYQNLTLKSMFMLKWATLSPCVRNYKFIVKADDDIFLNVPNLMQMLVGGTVPIYEFIWRHYKKQFGIVPTQDNYPLSEEQRKTLIIGEIRSTSQPENNFNSKHYVPKYMYEQDYYPPYHHGPCYILSQNVVQRLLTASYTVPFFNIEDTYVTGVLAEKIGVKPFEPYAFTARPLGNPCGCRGSVFQNMNNNAMSPKIMQDIFDASIECEVHKDEEK